MNIEVMCLTSWTPGLTLALQQLLQQSVRNGWPLITCLRPDATAEQIEEIDHQICGLGRVTDGGGGAGDAGPGSPGL